MAADPALCDDVVNEPVIFGSEPCTDGAITLPILSSFRVAVALLTAPACSSILAIMRVTFTFKASARETFDHARAALHPPACSPAARVA